jgi:uncharacterized protein
MIHQKIEPETISASVSEQERPAVLYNVLTSERLELTIFPTEHCNFRCIYCYEDFKAGRMKPLVINGIKNLISNRAADLKYLQISWFGGEPMIAYDVVLDVSRHAYEIGQNRGFNTIIGMTTNGYNLTKERFIELYETGVRSYQISLDGDKNEHDKTRLRSDGSGTFDQIWDNLSTYNKLSESGIIKNTRIILRLHLHRDNIHSMLRLAAKIAKCFNDKFFYVHIKELGYYGGKNDGDFGLIEDSCEFETIKRDIMSALHPFVEVESNGINICYAAKANAYTIRADGSIGKCTVALKSNRNSIGRLCEDGTIALDGTKAGLWLHPLSSMSISGLACPLQYLPALPDHGT